MKANGFVIRSRGGLVLYLWLALAGGVCSSQAAYYQVGQVVTNFLVYARENWTNSAGFPDVAPMRLQDFAGKIIFVEFFDPT